MEYLRNPSTACWYVHGVRPFQKISVTPVVDPNFSRFCSGEQEAALSSANEQTLHVSASQFRSPTDVLAHESGCFDVFSGKLGDFKPSFD